MPHSIPNRRDEPVDQAKNRVLVIEDDSSMAEIVLMALGQAHYQGVHLLNAELGLQMLKSKSFDAVICDVNLSANKSGIDFYIEVRKLRLHAGAFLFMTGQAIDRDVLSNVDHQGGQEPVIFFKPFSVGRIINTLNDMLRSPKSGPKPAVAGKVAALAPAEATDAASATVAVEESRLAMLRHDLSNKAMIATENLGIAITLRERELAAAAGLQPPPSPSGRKTSEQRIQAAKDALDEICTLLEDWRAFDRKGDS